MVPNYDTMTVPQLKKVLREKLYPNGEKPPKGEGLKDKLRPELLRMARRHQPGAYAVEFETPFCFTWKLAMISDGGAEQHIACPMDYHRLFNRRAAPPGIVLETANGDSRVSEAGDMVVKDVLYCPTAFMRHTGQRRWDVIGKGSIRSIFRFGP